MDVEQDVGLLVELGRRLETEPGALKGASVRDLLMRSWLKIRDKQGRLAPFVLNPVQKEFQRGCGRRNIVLKARQLGLTTYVAGRFFVETVTRPGTLTVQVAHDQRSAEEIFRIVHRFLENLPGKSGSEKKEAALSFIGSALSMTDAIAAREIVDADKFKNGLGQIVDGVVECLNASAWAKAKA